MAAVVAIAATIAMTFGATAFLGASLATIAAAASTVSTLAALGARALQKPPDMRGTVNEVMIGANMPVPYVIGRTFVGGMKVFDDSVDNQDGDDNYDRTQIFVGTHAGPIDSFEAFKADYSTIGFSGSGGGLISGNASGFYNDFLYLNSKLGQRPDSALGPVTGINQFRGWSTAHKLSGMACWSATMQFDKKGKRWASGIPAFGMVAKWVKAYDPRLDSTYPGGSGSQRWDDEATWTWTANPGLHALTYARGRFMGSSSVKVVGCGIPQDAIEIPVFVELANTCDANGWDMGGAIYEGPGISRWDNLKRILATGAAEPCWVGGRLSCRISAPKVALDTITADDLADGDVEMKVMASWKDKFNTIVPRYRSESHRWEYVQANAVTSSTYLAEDGETKTDEVQFDLCQDVHQAVQLAGYALANRREFGPITLNCKPRLMAFRPGEALEIDLPEAGLVDQLAVIISRTVDPAMGTVQLVLESETSAKHTFALTQTGTAPPTPTIYPPEDIDEAVSAQNPALASIGDISPVVITADYQGTVDPSDQLPLDISLKRYSAGEDVTALSAWAIDSITGNITASIGAADGALSITALGGSGDINVSAIYGGVTVTKLIPIGLSVAAPPATGGGGGGGGGTQTSTDTSFNSINSTSHASISDELTVVVGASGNVDLSATLTVSTFAAISTGVFKVYGIWRWWNGSAYVDVGTEVSSNPDAEVIQDAETAKYSVRPKGGLTVVAQKPGLTVGSAQKFQFFARNNSGTRMMTFSGTVSAVS